MDNKLFAWQQYHHKKQSPTQQLKFRPSLQKTLYANKSNQFLSLFYSSGQALLRHLTKRRIQWRDGITAVAPFWVVNLVVSLVNRLKLWINHPVLWALTEEVSLLAKEDFSCTNSLLNKVNRLVKNSRTSRTELNRTTFIASINIHQAASRSNKLFCEGTVDKWWFLIGWELSTAVRLGRSPLKF